MFKVILMMLLAVVSNSAAAGWLEIGGDYGMTTYADPTTIRKNGDRVKIWAMYDFRTAQENPGSKPWLSSKAQDEYDCKEEQRRIIAFSWFSGNMGAGDVVSSNSDPGKWEPVALGSIGENLWKVACGKQ